MKSERLGLGFIMHRIGLGLDLGLGLESLGASLGIYI
jgi:hypothetical protein